jgi:hypothetical protein
MKYVLPLSRANVPQPPKLRLGERQVQFAEGPLTTVEKLTPPRVVANTSDAE